MQKQLIRHGNSYALVIDRPILELLEISPSVPLKLTTDGISLILTPVTTSETPKAAKSESSPLWKGAKKGERMKE